MQRLPQLAILATLATACLGAQAQTLGRIERSNTLTVAYRDGAMPFSYVVPGQKEPIGLAIDLCKEIAQGLKRDLGLSDLRIRYVAVPAADAIKAIQQGKADIECSSTTDTRQRREEVSFSHHHFYAGVQLMTRVNAGVKEWKDIAKRGVTVTAGTSARDVLARHKLTKDLKFTVVEGADFVESFRHLNNGKADAWALENVLLVGMRASDRNPRAWEIVGEQLSVEPYALMFKKGDADFQRAVNKELERIFQSGEYQKMYERWFMNPIPPRNVNLKLEPGALLRAQMRRPKSVIPDWN